MKDAINSFVKELPFNGRMNVLQLIEAIKSVPGVEDVVNNGIDSRYGILPFSNVRREIVPFAGHMVLADSESVISYFPYV